MLHLIYKYLVVLMTANKTGHLKKLTGKLSKTTVGMYAYANNSRPGADWSHK